MMEEDLLTATTCFLILCGDSRKRKRKCWVRPSLKKREEYGGQELLSDLKKDDVLLELRTDGCFKNFLRMSSSDMEFLLQKIAPVIRKADTNCRKAIPPQERLAVTLRFLATGDSYSSLMYLFKISKQAISKIVPEVCAALVNAIKDQVKMPKTAQEWETLTNGFSVLWNFPKCVGVMDGKHIAIQAPKNSGSSQGRISDGGVFDNTLFKKLLTGCKLNLPEYSALPGREKLVPHVFLGDDAFPLSPNLLKPYPGAQEKGSPKRIFNYRLSRARRISENVFGMLSSIFRIFRKPLLLEPETAEVVVMACIYLHNFLRNSSGSKHSYNPPGTYDGEDKDTGRVLEGSWRREPQSNTFTPYKKVARNAATEAKDIRQEFADFFVTPLGMVPWQNNF